MNIPVGVYINRGICYECSPEAQSRCIYEPSMLVYVHICVNFPHRKGYICSWTLCPCKQITKFCVELLTSWQKTCKSTINKLCMQIYMYQLSRSAMPAVPHTESGTFTSLVWLCPQPDPSLTEWFLWQGDLWGYQSPGGPYSPDTHSSYLAGMGQGVFYLQSCCSSLVRDHWLLKWSLEWPKCDLNKQGLP